jgi:hypothetical protein
LPFTFSHPAIILPLLLFRRRWFSLTGLIIGSLTPDFEYFLRMKIEGGFSHSIIGVFLFDLPFGIFLAFLFHNIIRNNLFNNLPLFLASRVSIFKQFNWNLYFKKNWLIVIISTLIGAFSHIFWDSFTHENKYFVNLIPLLKNTVEFVGFQMPIFKILQHLSTLIGGIIIGYAIFKLPVNHNLKGSLSISYWSVLTGVTFTIIAIRLLTGLDYKLYPHVIATSISAFIIALTFTPSVLEKIKRKI